MLVVILCLHDYQRMRRIYSIKGPHLAARTITILSYYVSECSELAFIYQLLALNSQCSQFLPPSPAQSINTRVIPGLIEPAKTFPALSSAVGTIA